AAGLNPSERGGQRQQGAAGRSSLGPLVPGTLRGAESSAVYRRLAVEIERHWFVGEPARLADDVRAAVARALQTLDDDRRTDVHCLDLLAAALQVLGETDVTAPELLADLAGGPVLRDLLGAVRQVDSTPSSARPAPVDPATLAYAAVRSADVLIHSDE